MKNPMRIVSSISHSSPHSTAHSPYPSPYPPRASASFRISAQTIAAVCFFAGIAFGTVWVGVMPDALKAQLGLFGQAQLRGTRPAADPALLLHIFLLREAQAGFLWLIGMTAFAVPAFLLTALYIGFSSAALLSLMTMQSGLLGLPVYLASVLPQALLYLPAIAVLFFWGFEPFKKTHLAGFVVLSAVIGLGAFAECFLNPLLLGAVSLIR